MTRKLQEISMSAALSAAIPAPKLLFPPITRDLVITALIAGMAADLSWEVWARAITPFLPGVGGPLEPAALVQSVFGLKSRFLAEIIHLVVGFVFYPLGYLFIARPLAQAIVPALPWWFVAAGFGVALWTSTIPIQAAPVNCRAPSHTTSSRMWSRVIRRRPAARRALSAACRWAATARCSMPWTIP